MAIKASGSLALSEIASEFGDSQPHSMSEFIRGGSLVPQADANNNIPTSTSNMSFDDFFGAVNVIAVTASSGTNVSASSLFGSNWTVDVPKELIIPSGVTLGATSTSNFALTIESNLAGTLTVKNSGSIQGSGGAAGANGGDAIDANASCIIINESTGQIYAGGGGGGTGGTGGGGQFSTTTNVNVGQGNQVSGGGSPSDCINSCTSRFGGGANCASYGSPTCKVVGGDNTLCYSCLQPQTTTTNTDGGAGGSGGVGQGYNQSATSGSAGASGGTNAGTGGTGGTGGAFGASGATGSSGANGNRTNGLSGSAGGSAGRYINGIANVTLTNNGAVAGGTV